MKNSEHLFYLIKSLTKAEKRSFKLFAKNNSKGNANNYTILFDVIDKMDKYDHELLIKKLKGKIDASNISTIKVQLNNLILKSIRSSGSIDSINSDLRLQIDFLVILYEKGLYSQFKKLAAKVKPLAKLHSLFVLLDYIVILESQVALKQANSGELRNYLDNIYPEAKEARKFNDILAEFEYLAIDMRLLLLESSSVGGDLTIQKLDEIVSHPLLKLSETELKEYPNQCSVDYHTIWGHYHYASLNKNEAYHHRKAALIYFEKDFQAKGSHSVTNRLWLSYVRYLLVSLSTYKMFVAFDAELERVRQIIDQTPISQQSVTFRDELYRTLENIQFHRDLDEGNFEKISFYLESLDNSFKNSLYQMDTSLKMSFHFNMSYALFGLGRYKEALKWNNKLLDDPSMRNMREDIKSYALVLNICIHYCLGNYELISSLIQSTKRFLLNHNRLNPMELEFLSFANKGLNKPFSKELKPLFLTTTSVVSQLSKEQNLGVMLDYVDINSWIKSIVEQSSLEKIMKQN